MATGAQGLAEMRARVQKDGYRLGDAWRQDDGTYRVEAWKEGAAFQLTPAAGVGKTEREALADLLRTLDGGW
jgi:hypothetical protein